MKELRAVLAGLRHNTAYGYTLAPAVLKAYAEARPSLKGRARVEVLQRTTADLPALVAADMAALAPDLAGFSCYIWNLEQVLAACRELRALRPGTRIVLGGPEAAPQAPALLARHPEVDYICLGEGEEVFAELLERLSAGDSPEGMAGLAWRGPGGPAAGPERPPIADLDSVPSPLLLGLLPVHDGDKFVIESSRGCPHRCAFCDWQNGRPVRVFSPERVLAEARYLLDRVPKFFVLFSDSDVFTDLPRAKRLLRRLGPMAAGRACRFTFQTYLPRVDDEAMRLLDAEQFLLGGGVESASAPALKAMARFFDRAALEASVARLRALAPRCRLELQLIYALPGDDLAGYRASLDWVLSLEPDLLSLQHALALPGADFGRRPGHYGLTVEPGPPHRVTAVSTFPAHDIATAGRLSFAVVALNEDKLFRWCAARLKVLTGLSSLRVWEELAAGVEEGAPSAGLAAAYAGADAYVRAFDLAGVRWYLALGLAANLALWRSLLRSSRAALSRAGRETAWPAFRREFTRRSLRLCAERLLSGPAVSPLIRRVDRLLGPRAGRPWQALKFAVRRALRQAPSGGAA